MKTKTKIWLALGVTALAIAALLWLFFTGAIKINVPDENRYPVRGVDVSEYQGQIDWPRLAEQGMQFAFIKATEGSSYVDPFFQSNWQGTEAAGVLSGAYHFFSFDSAAETQAENFIATVPARAGMLPPVVDVELYGVHKQKPPQPEAVRAELALLLGRLEAAYGQKPILYATRKAYALYIDGAFSEYPIWIRDMYFTPQLPAERQWTFWQYTDKGELDGYEGPERFIDINVFAGSAEELKRLCA